MSSLRSTLEESGHWTMETAESRNSAFNTFGTKGLAREMCCFYPANPDSKSNSRACPKFVTVPYWAQKLKLTAVVGQS